MEQNITIPKEAEQLAKDSEGMLAKYEKFEIVSSDDFILTGGILTKVKANIKTLTTLRKTMTDPLDESRDKIMDFFRSPIDKLKIIEAGIKQAKIDYTRKRERIEQEEQKKLQEAAQKEEERQKKILADKIARAKKSGKTEKVEELKQEKEQVFIPAPIVASTVPKVKGESIKKDYKFRIVNEGLIPRQYLCADEKKIGAMVRASKGTLKISGIEIYAEDNLSASTKG